MKVTVELYGATKDLSKNNFLELKNRQSKEITIIKINNLNKIIQEIK